jgi:hypothetical protein
MMLGHSQYPSTSQQEGGFPGNQPNKTYLSMNYSQRDVEEARGSLHLLKKRMNSGGKRPSQERM